MRCLSARLLRFAGPTALPLLHDALVKGTGVLRRVAAESIADVADPTSLPILRARLTEQDSDTRAALFCALSRVCTAEDSEALIAALSDRHRPVREFAALGLIRLAKAFPSPVLREAIPLIRRAGGYSAFGLHTTYREAIRLIEAIPDDPTGDTTAHDDLRPDEALVLTDLHLPEEPPRFRALRLFARKPDLSQLPQIRRLLDDPSPRVRRLAATTLYNVHKQRRYVPGSIVGVSEMLTPDMIDAAIKGAYAYAANDLPTLRDALLHPNDQAPVGYAFISALIPPQKTDAIPRLATMLEHDTWQVRYLAASLMREVGPPALPYLHHSLERGNWILRGVAAEALAGIAHPSSAPILRSKLNEMDHGTRAAIYFALAAVCTEEDTNTMLTGLTDVQDAIRECAAFGLARLAVHYPDRGLRRAIPLLRRMRSPYGPFGFRTTFRDAIRAIEDATATFADLPIPGENAPKADNLPLPADPDPERHRRDIGTLPRPSSEPGQL